MAIWLEWRVHRKTYVCTCFVLIRRTKVCSTFCFILCMYLRCIVLGNYAFAGIFNFRGFNFHVGGAVWWWVAAENNDVFHVNLLFRKNCASRERFPRLKNVMPKSPITPKTGTQNQERCQNVILNSSFFFDSNFIVFLPLFGLRNSHLISSAPLQYAKISTPRIFQVFWSRFFVWCLTNVVRRKQ